MNNEISEQPRRGVGRRTVVKGAAWAVPAVALAAAAPAYAKSGIIENPCLVTGPYYVALWSPDNTKVLKDRPNPTGSTTVANPTGGGNCVSQAPGCTATAGHTLTTLTGIALDQTNQINISHDTSFANQGEVTFTLKPESCCTITKVKGHLHRFGSATSPDCPNPYCQEAGGTFLGVSGLNTKSVTVTPNGGTLCGKEEVHWGSPNKNGGCTPSNNQQANAFSNGQPRGFLILELNCVAPTP